MSPESRHRPSLPKPETLLRGVLGLLLGALVCSGVVYALANVDLLHYEQLFPACPFRTATGFPCPGCGMTRAFLLLSQLRIGEAVAAHPAAPLLLIGMTGWAARPPRWPPAVCRAMARVALVMLAVFWTLRLATS